MPSPPQRGSCIFSYSQQIPVLICLFSIQQARTKQVEQEYLRQIDPIAKEDHKAADVLANGGSVGLGVVQQAQENQRKS